MRTCLPSTLLLLLPFLSFAQHDLPTSPQHSAAVYAYRLTGTQARDLFRSDLRGWEKIVLPPPADSFPASQLDDPRLSPGNYLFIRTVESRLEVTLRTVGSLRYRLLANGNDAALVLQGPNGRPVTDAAVAVREHAIRFDPGSGYYVLGRWRKSRTVQVSYQGASYFFPVDYRTNRRWSQAGRWWRRLWHTRRYSRYRPSKTFQFQQRYRSFFALSKPKYKPGDTVSGKAFIMDRKGRPVEGQLLLRLGDRDHTEDTVLMTVVPYRPGGYSFSFVLSDSLKLELDDDYELSLEPPRKHRRGKDEDDEDDDWRDRKVYSVAGFHYEEYDLTSIRLKARADREKQSSGEPLSVYLQALDENDLPVPDGRVELTVLTSGVGGFRDAAVFVRDTLWQWSQRLDPVGETRVILPDSIFPAAAFGYTIQCRLLSSDNETSEQELTVQYSFDPATIDFHLHGDSVAIDYRHQGRPVTATARVLALTEERPIDSALVLLPASVRVNSMATSYEVTVVHEGDTLTDEYELPSEAPEFPIWTRRTTDSVEIRVDDTLHMPFWYTLMAGTKPVLRGYGERLDFRERSAGPEPYYFRLQYLWKGGLREETRNLAFFEKQMHVTVRQPRWVYPGQRVNIDVAVTDARGHAVPDADLTAYGWTAKFKEGKLPGVPYFGRQWRYPQPGSYRVRPANAQKQTSLPLDWSRWNGVFGLDSIEYYKFLNPRTIYVTRQRTPDGVTQLAPFVTRRGQPEPVHLLYLDERLIFIDRAEQRRYYSFPASPGWHTLRIRVHDRELRVDSILLAPGVKTILGINDDPANPAIQSFPRPDTLSNWEKDLLHQTLITIQPSFSPHFATVSQGVDRMYLVEPANGGSARPTVLTGPFNGADALLDVRDGFRQFFEPEGGNQFIIQPGLIKEKQWPYAYPFGQRLDSARSLSGLGDRALTNAIADSLWLDWLDERSASQDLYVNAPTAAKLRGVLQVGLSSGAEGKVPFVIKVFVFRYDDADFLHVHKGRTTRLGTLEAGVYRVLLLLKGDRYLLHESVVVRPNGLNYYECGRLPVHAADSFSRRIAGMLRHLEDRWVDPKSRGMDSLHFVFNDRYMGPNAFDGEVGGVVADASGTPVAGATVMVKGTRQATVTDGNGRFHLRTPARGTLVFMSIGYETIEKPFSGAEQYSIRLHPSNRALDEVVVVGYGVARKRDVTASVTSIAGNVFGLSITQDAALEGSLPATAAFPAIPEMPGLDTVRSIRRRFRDDAFWQPRLRTDAQGLASFSVTYPDDITAWNTYFIAIAGRGRTGFALSGVRSAKPLSARLSNPGFLVAGDSAFVIGKLLNYGRDTVTVNRRFEIGGREIAVNILRFRNAQIDTFLVGPAAGLGRGASPDSMHIRYTLQRPDGYFDGEERSIPVFPAGVRETRGSFAPLEGDTSLKLHFDTALGPVHIFAGASLLPVLLDEIEKIRQYEYLCNEQLASKLMALLQKQRIYKLEQSVFQEDRNIRELIDRLMKARGGKPLWGWWLEGNGMPWISLHVTQALLAAEKAGYATGLDKQSLIDFLVYNFESGTSFDRLLDLRMLQELGARVDYRRYADTAVRHIDRSSMYQVLRLQEIRQTAGLPLTGLDTLISKLRTTALGNQYWGENGRLFFENSVQVTVLMYRVLRVAGGYEPLLRKARNWLLEQRGAGHWRNTYESSLILETLLPDLLVDGKPPKMPELSVNGRRVADFPYQDLLPAGAGVDLRKSGVLPVYFTAYQQFFNPAPQRVEGVFAVRSRFVSEGATTERLTAGKPVTLVVEVEAKADADYVLVEIPIPAGCTYSDKSQWYGDQGIHREYFKNKLSIFCPSLRKGNHRFEVQLLPRWTGVYRLNPARAELMYFPVLYGREEMKRTIIE